MVGFVVFALSVAAYAVLTSQWPGVWKHTDASVYRAAGDLVMHRPGALYTDKLGAPRLPFTYPPFAALLFALPSPLPFAVWEYAVVAVNVVLLPVIAYACLSLAGLARRPKLTGTFLVAAVALWLEPVYMTTFFGQINLILLALIAVDLALPERSRFKGIGIGLAAGIKLTPLIFIVYLWFAGFRRAAVTAVVTVVTTVIVGFAFLPAASADFWGGRMMRPGDGPERLVNQSLNGVVSRLAGEDATAWWLAAALPVGLLGLAVAVTAGRRGLGLVAFLACGVTSLLVSPISWSHHWVYTVPALALALSFTGSRALRWTAATAVAALFVMWPSWMAEFRGIPSSLTVALSPRGWLRHVDHDGGKEYDWQGLQLIGGNYYVLAGLAFLIGTAVYLHRTRTREAASPIASAPEPADQVQQPLDVPAR
ncbi:glycosyltransferase 87 family protein [Actinomadura fulvescens]|uniref:Glycosyltransferase 87 family protein n=1 Tax=Actinomadura fulvescens TaxID=46160 RepID=A0ABN3Q3U1_9ACTN